MVLVTRAIRRTVKICTVLFVTAICFPRPSSGQTTTDSVIVSEPGSAGGFEAGHAWRGDGFDEFFFRLFYETQIGKTYFNAGAFSYQKINDGFGFDFRLRMPWIFYPAGSHTNFSPVAGISFTVWPQKYPVIRSYDQGTISIGIPIGVEYEFLIKQFPNISVSANAAPQITFSHEVPNMMIYDLRIGIRFD
jgi:hypothetical protein